jgi:AcrR family transcriptional regulator
MPAKPAKKRIAPKTDGAMPEKSRRGAATMTKLIAVTAKELDRVGLAKVDVESLLKKSKISKGSLYHHFGNKNGLLAAAAAQQFVTYLQSEGEAFRTLIENCASKKDFLKLIAGVMKITSLKRNREFRQKRVRAIAMSFNEKNLSKVIKAEQLIVTQYLAETFAIAQKRGWIKPDIDLVALSYFFQGVFIGHILLDITNQTEYDERWSEIAFKALLPFLVVD